MKHSEIREAYAQHSTFLISARFAGFPGLRASHFIQATIMRARSHLDPYPQIISSPDEAQRNPG
ncbi:hypothetical protein, partial [Legionella bononiensis]|uniref:hypothetical protein n=1 Tax=Legionella bononiensis TaxID=2793102 RepID=UPI001EE45B18